jgi:hypothetical protein
MIKYLPLEAVRPGFHAFDSLFQVVHADVEVSDLSGLTPSACG